MKKRLFILSLFFSVSLFSDSNIYKDLSLKDALEIVKKKNLEINIADFDRQVRELDVKIAKGYNYGKLDLTMMGIRSNDAGNVFGFKLQSREASFADFGFDEFLAPLGGALMKANSDSLTIGDMMSMSSILDIGPEKLNHPDARNHFDTKFTYMLPIYTGHKLTRYKEIAKKMVQMSKLDKDKVISEKIFQVKKSYYDISLLNNFHKNLKKVEKNIVKLKNTIVEMKKEGYTKKTDILEVESKLSNIERMIYETKAYKKLAYQFLEFLLNAKVDSIQTVSLDAPDYKITEEDVVQQNRDIQKAQTGLEIQTKMVDVAKSALKPEVGAFAEYGSSDDKFLHDFKNHDRYTMGVQVKYNIFNGGIDYIKVEQEKIKKLQVQNQVELAKKGMALKAAKIQTEIKSFDFQIKSLKKELELALEIYNTYQERYKEGLSSINDVIIKQSKQIEKLLHLQRIQNKRNEKILELERLAYGEEK